MKSRIGAALSPLFNATHRRYVFEATSAKPSLALFNGDGRSNRTLIGLQVQGIGSLKRFSHSFAHDEDDFSELGSPVVQGAGTLLKLVTQKPEPHWVQTRRSEPVKKHSSGRPLPAESSSRAKDVINSQVDSSSRTVATKSGNSRKGYNFVVDPNLEPDSKNNSKPDSKSKLSELKASDTTKSTSITVEDIPSAVGLSQLIEAISGFGKVSSTFMKTACNGLEFCVVNYESVDSRTRAVSVGGITVNGFHLPIRPWDISETIAIEIKNINSKTADAAIHSACTSSGPLQGLARTKEDSVDAIYIVKDVLESQSILQKLNDTITDGQRWSAHLLERDLTSNGDDKCKLGLQISCHLSELKRQFCATKMELEDLDYLHTCIVHLEETPEISNRCS